MSSDVQKSSLVPIDGITLAHSVDAELLDLFKCHLLCRWCGTQVHADSFQVQAYNGGVLFTTIPHGHPLHDMYAETTAIPHIYCGCSDACMARDLAFGLDHLKKLGVVD